MDFVMDFMDVMDFVTVQDGMYVWPHRCNEYNG
jgi:hypothetical protein